MSLLTPCRFCMEDKLLCIPLRQGQGAEMLEALIAVKVTYSKKVSTSVCLQCFQELKSAYDTQQKMKRVELQHHDKVLADFLRENHSDLVMLAQEGIVQMQIKDATTTTEVDNPVPLVKTDVKEPSIKHVCGLCGDKFQFSLDFVNHLHQHILSKKKSHVICDILCEACGEIFPSLEAYNEHKNTQPIFVCNICSASFTSQDMLEGHSKEKHTSTKQFVCDVCNERFALRYVMQAHKVQHSIKNPFVCEICGRNFKSSVNLEIHQKMAHTVATTNGNQFVFPVKKT